MNRAQASHDPEDVLHFWLDEIGEKGWYVADPDVDARVRERFEPLWRAARDERGLGWTSSARGCLALLIVLDQFPRNMFRQDGTAFSTDAAARAVAKRAIERGFDLQVSLPERQFFYTPLLHSECLADQERCVRLCKERMQDLPSQLLHARAHREIIRRYGRFPHRNDDLGRSTTSAEQSYLDAGGYGAVVQEFQQAA